VNTVCYIFIYSLQTSLTRHLGQTLTWGRPAPYVRLERQFRG